MKKLTICDISGIASTRGINNEELLTHLNSLTNFNCSFCTGKGYSGGYETLKDVDIKVELKIATGTVKSPKELLDLFDIYIPLGELPDFIRKIDKKDIKCYNQFTEKGREIKI